MLLAGWNDGCLILVTSVCQSVGNLLPIEQNQPRSIAEGLTSSQLELPDECATLALFILCLEAAPAEFLASFAACPKLENGTALGALSGTAPGMLPNLNAPFLYWLEMFLDLFLLQENAKHSSYHSPDRSLDANRPSAIPFKPILDYWTVAVIPQLTS